VAQRGGAPAKVVVDSEALDMFIERSELAQKRKIFAWVLLKISVPSLVSRIYEVNAKEKAAYLLRILCDEQYEREIVHPQRSIKQLICIREEYDILDGILDHFRRALYVGMSI
jgi:hypothetical protein